MTTARTDPGSFRDREGRVFYLDGTVYRALSSRALEQWEALSGASFFAAAMGDGRVVRTKRVELPEHAPRSGAQPWVAALEHQRIPFISYPYEWSFSMLRDAAGLQLSLLDSALAEGFVLKDSSSYNIQWLGSSPILIDVPSFQKLAGGEPWVGYLQFCELFLYPLMLTAYRDTPFQPWLRGSLDGITPEVCNALFSFRDRFRSGVFTHVYLQAKLQKMTADSNRSVRKDLENAGFSKDLIESNVKRLGKLVGSLSWRRTSSEWVGYRDCHSYSDADHEAKQTFVEEATAEARRSLVWDLGCNTGEYSRIAAQHADYVVAMDVDHLAIDRLYLELRERGPSNILPLVGNLADPSPSLGWRGQERRQLADRGRPDLILALALIHHLVIRAHIPLEEVVDSFAELGSDLVIEFVHKDDAMVQKLLLNKEDRYADYEQSNLERCLEKHFEIVRRQTLGSGTRTLYYARRSSDPSRS